MPTATANGPTYDHRRRDHPPKRLAILDQVAWITHREHGTMA